MKITKLLISLAVCFAVGYAGSLATLSSLHGWYETIHKPPFTPPNYLFAAVWSVIYLLMALSLALMWTRKNKKTMSALLIFYTQLLLNLLWPFIFFRLSLPAGGLIVIILLWIAIVQTIKFFLPISKISAYLLIPYLVWVTFAAILNGAIVILN